MEIQRDVFGSSAQTNAASVLAPSQCAHGSLCALPIQQGLLGPRRPKRPSWSGNSAHKLQDVRGASENGLKCQSSWPNELLASRAHHSNETDMNHKTVTPARVPSLPVSRGDSKGGGEAEPRCNWQLRSQFRKQKTRLTPCNEATVVVIL